MRNKTQVVRKYSFGRGLFIDEVVYLLRKIKYNGYCNYQGNGKEECAQEPLDDIQV